MALIGRTYECGLGHRWKDIVERAAPMPSDCPICDELVRAGASIGGNNPPPDITEAPGAPAIRGERTKAVTRFESHAFKRVNCDDERTLLGNLKDNVREGENYAILETPRTNETMKMMVEQNERAKAVGANPTPWGFQPVDGNILASAGGPQNAIGRQVVDIKTKKAMPRAAAK
jgi:hypothetical protein